MPLSLSFDDTIVAIASAPGGAARGIVRLSGAGVDACLRACFEPQGTARGTVEHAQVWPGHWRLPPPTARLPCDVYCWPAGRSYTGEPVAEVHTLGSPPLLEVVVRTMCAAGARLAEPGEFTLRAFLSGRIDLPQAEAVLGIIDAGGRAELDAALEQMAGGLSRPLGRLRSELLDLVAVLEAGFDFPDEDLPFIAAGELTERLSDAGRQVETLAGQISARGESDGRLRAALIGMPNVGKSSLFNALSAQAALVSAQPGTTRDYLVAEIDLGSARCELIDTAGIGWPAPEEADTLHAAAQAGAARQAGRAQLQLLCLDATRPLDDWERRRLAAAAHDERLRVVLTKSDRPPATNYDGPAIRTSSRSGAGLDELRRMLRDAVTRRPAGGAVASTAVRCGASLRLAAEALARAREAHAAGAGEELVAIDVRQALYEIGKVVGAVYTGDVLDVIFSRFCIGK